MLVDSHCHLESDEVAMRAYAGGVTCLLNAGKDLDEAGDQLEMCERMGELRESGENAPMMWTSAGVHPDSAPRKLNNINVDDIVKMSCNPYIIAIGECGLDYHYGAEYKDEQKEMMKRHIEAAGMTGLPIMIHQREAEDDMISLLYEGKKKYPNLKGVIHCFTASKDFADKVNEIGFYISASGIITFKSAVDVLEVFKSYPREKVLIETDSPYLAPVPYRGKENEPAFMLKTAEKLAEAWNCDVETVAKITKENFFRLYDKASIKSM